MTDRKVPLSRGRVRMKQMDARGIGQGRTGSVGHREGGLDAFIEI